MIKVRDNSKTGKFKYVGKRLREDPIYRKKYVCLVILSFAH